MDDIRDYSVLTTRKRILLIIVSIMFISSFFLPATAPDSPDGGSSMYESFTKMMRGFDFSFKAISGFIVLSILFGANYIIPFVIVRLWVGKPKWLTILMICALINQAFIFIISWLIVMSAGLYLWFFSGVLLFFIAIVEEQLYRKKQIEC